MKRKPRGRVDPIEYEIERALRPGAFIGDHVCFSFVRHLDEVAPGSTRLLRATRPADRQRWSAWSRPPLGNLGLRWNPSSRKRVAIL